MCSLWTLVFFVVNSVMEARKSITNNDQKLESLYSDARAIIESARTNAVRSVDFCRVQMYWHLGQRIFVDEQQGK